MRSERQPVSIRRAEVRFLLPDEGGRSTPPVSGVRSQIELGEFQTSCVVESASKLTEIPLGKSVLVDIHVLFADKLGDAFANLDVVRLFEGNKLVAIGLFVELGEATASS